MCVSSKLISLDGAKGKWGFFFLGQSFIFARLPSFTYIGQKIYALEHLSNRYQGKEDK